MRVDTLDLPDEAIQALKSTGIKELFPPQADAVRNGLLKGSNLVIAAPTASGKTLIGILAILKHILEYRGKALYLTPLRALAYEKYEDIHSIGSKLGLRVALSMGDYDSADPWLGEYDVIVTTNEKADSLLRHSPPWLKALTLLVADEIHTVNDPHRGPTLEMVVARFIAQCGEDRQILALSATIGNPEDLATWLNAKIVQSNWRPVTLKEGVYYDGEIYFKDGEVKEVPLLANPVIDLIIDCLQEGGQALAFAPTRHTAVTYATKAARYISKYLKNSEKKQLLSIAKEILKEGTNRLNVNLAEAVKRGVAFHHAGLSNSVRKIVEKAFTNQYIKAIVATPTLAAGVNLPARRVIICSYRRYNVELGVYEKIPIMEYKQMAGRAGRPKYDPYGEAVLIARTLDEADALMSYYIMSPPEKIYSKLASEEALKSHILAAISSGFTTKDDLYSLFKHTLYAVQFDLESIERSISSALSFLHVNSLIRVDNDYLAATSLGRRVSQLYIKPTSAVIILEHLQQIKKPIPIAYLYMICCTPDMPTLYLRRGEYEKYEEKALELLGDIAQPKSLTDPYDYEMFLARLKTAMLLYDWIEEVPEESLVENYDIGPGDLYSITQTAEWILYSATEMAKEAGFFPHVHPLLILRKRVKHGVKEELLELVSIPGIGRTRARILFKHGYRSLEQLSKASIGELSSLPLIGATLARRIKEYLEGTSEEQAKGDNAEALEASHRTLDAFF